MASKKFTQFDTANNTPETELSVGVKGTDNFKRRNYLTATANPTVNDDNSDGFTVGSIWLNTSTGAMYICTDSTVGAAVWVAQRVLYKSFLGYFSQAGTNNPVITTIYNDTGRTLSMTRVEQGVYFGTLSGSVIDSDKLYYICKPS